MTSRTGPRQKHKQSSSKQHKSVSATSAVNPTRSTNIRTKQNKSSTAPKKEIQIVDPVSQDGESKAESGTSSIIFDLDESIEEGSIDQMSFSGLSVDFDD
ncbi:MAG: hypothetical protein EZS28_053505 [Streblomastix strix]|uniref:Uncharacterized protein n=1 Tax=Streblomastix strix TaxID=222440 RepID=A0A5J4RA25_9EUKA|nr:MAG: hypothetical protein EZS28_053505 [Streblomastix strix]